MTTRIFISYSHKDEAFARQLAWALCDAGADIWIDIEDIPAGVKWSTAIQQGLRITDVLLVILSPEAMQSRHVEDEWQYVLDRNKPVVPIHWRPTEIHFQLSRIQYVDFHSQPFNHAMLSLLLELQRLNFDIVIPDYLEETYRRAPNIALIMGHNQPKLPVRLPAPPTIASRKTKEMPAVSGQERKRSKVWLVVPFMLLLIAAALFTIPMLLQNTNAEASAPQSAQTVPVLMTVTPQTPAALQVRILTHTNTNIRALDDLASKVVHILHAGERAVVVARNPDDSWLLITYVTPSGDAAQGWVARFAINLEGNLNTVPVFTHQQG